MTCLGPCHPHSYWSSHPSLVSQCPGHLHCSCPSCSARRILPSTVLMSWDSHRAGDGMVLGVVSRFGVSCPIPEAAQALPSWSRVGGLICLLVTVEVSQELYQSSLCEVLQALRCQAPLLAMCLGSSIAGAFLSPQNLRGCLVSEALAWSSALRPCSAGPQSPTTQAGPTAGAARGHRDLSATRAPWTLTPLSCQATVPGCATRPLPGEQQGHTAHLSPQATAAPLSLCLMH